MSSLDELVDEAMKNADLSIQTFEEMDKNLDGYLDEEEYPGDIEALDTNGDGKISAQEFARTFPSKKDVENRALNEANDLFTALDTNKNGFLSKCGTRGFGSGIAERGERRYESGR